MWKSLHRTQEIKGPLEDALLKETKFNFTIFKKGGGMNTQDSTRVGKRNPSLLKWPALLGVYAAKGRRVLGTIFLLVVINSIFLRKYISCRLVTGGKSSLCYPWGEGCQTFPPLLPSLSHPNFLVSKEDYRNFFLLVVVLPCTCSKVNEIWRTRKEDGDSHGLSSQRLLHLLAKSEKI